MRSGLTNSSSLRCGSSGRQCLDELAEGSVALRVLDLSPTTRSQTLQLSSTPTITAIKPRGASPTRATAAFGTLCRSLPPCCPAAFLRWNCAQSLYPTDAFSSMFISTRVTGSAHRFSLACLISLPFTESLEVSNCRDLSKGCRQPYVTAGPSQEYYLAGIDDYTVRKRFFAFS